MPISEKIKIQIVEGETEHVTYRGKRVRQPTILIQVGNWSLSKKAFLLGLFLAICQILDGLCTYIGLAAMGVKMEGNEFLQNLMIAYGKAPVLVGAKFVALVFVVILTISAHSRKWIRPIIAFLVAIYLVLAICPWIYIISSNYSISN